MLILFRRGRGIVERARPAARRFTHLRGSRKQSGGFTLLEILIAVLVMAIGLLGIAALQTAGIQFNRGAYFRSQATSLAYDIADRMRANRDAARGGAYNVAFANPAPNCAPAAGGGTVAEQDIAEWHASLACALPLGNGSIEVANDSVLIRISWDESRGEDGDAAELFEVVTGL